MHSHSGNCWSRFAVLGADSLELKFGNSPWLRAVHSLVSASGVLAVLISPANAVWKASAIGLLLLVALAIHFRSSNMNGRGTICLQQDGTAQLLTPDGHKASAVLHANGWATRWLCVLRLYESAKHRHHYCVICASENPPDPYRRLLVNLRMRSSDATVRRTIW
jgi:hypothetical protein